MRLVNFQLHWRMKTDYQTSYRRSSMTASKASLEGRKSCC